MPSSVPFSTPDSNASSNNNNQGNILAGVHFSTYTYILIKVRAYAREKEKPKREFGLQCPNMDFFFCVNPVIIQILQLCRRDALRFLGGVGQFDAEVETFAVKLTNAAQKPQQQTRKL